MLQELDHPHVVVYIDVFLHQVPEERSRCLQVCTVMDYCAGGDLAERLHRARLADEELEEAQMRAWLAQVAEGLAYLHDEVLPHGMVHRDVKPQNIFITQAPDGPPARCRAPRDRLRSWSMARDVSV